MPEPLNPEIRKELLNLGYSECKPLAGHLDPALTNGKVTIQFYPPWFASRYHGINIEYRFEFPPNIKRTGLKPFMHYTGPDEESLVVEEKFDAANPEAAHHIDARVKELLEKVKGL